MKYDEIYDYTKASAHGQSTLHDLLLETRILKIISECAVIAPTNYVNLTTGARRLTSKNKHKKLKLTNTRENHLGEDRRIFSYF